MLRWRRGKIYHRHGVLGHVRCEEAAEVALVHGDRIHLLQIGTGNATCLFFDQYLVDPRLRLERKLERKRLRRERVGERQLLDSGCKRRKDAHDTVCIRDRGGGDVALTHFEITGSRSDVSLPCGTSRGFALCDARDGAVVGEIVHLDDRSERVRVGGRYYHVVPTQAHRDVTRSRVEDGYLPAVTAHPALRERQSEIRNAVVRSGDEINRVLASSARIVEGVAAARVRSNGVEWSSAVRAYAVQDDPRSGHRVHALATGTHDASGNLLRNGWESGLHEQQDRQVTY